MKNINSDLKEDILNGYFCNCIKIVTKNNIVLTFTDHDKPLTIDGDVYTPGAGLTRVKMMAKANQEPSSQEVEAAWIEGVDEQDANNGVYDNATITFGWVSWKRPNLGQVVIFHGVLGVLTWTEEGFSAEVQNNIRLLQRPTTSMVTPNCRHSLGDTNDTNKAVPGGCNVNLANFTFTGEVTDILTNRRKFNISGNAATKDSGYFSTGVLTFTSGLNNGLITDVKLHDSGSIELYIPTHYEINTGDTFNIVAGCNGTLAVCKSKFNNVVNFGGFPHLQPEVNFR